MVNFSVQKPRSTGIFGLLPVGLVLVLLAATGCATRQPASVRAFEFPADTFAYANQLRWEYGFDDQGKWTATKREPTPDYTLHCFVVARSAKQFFQNAKFEPTAPKPDEQTRRRLIRQVVKTNPRKALSPEDKIVIPGYANLREFSADNERLLKEECGGAWQSYLQRGHWRMLLPFSRRGQAAEAEELAESVRRNGAAVVHIVRFPSLAVNHAILLFDVADTENALEFAVYDPNKPEAPTALTFDRGTRTFSFPRNDYFIGGKVDVYEVYNDFWN